MAKVTYFLQLVADEQNAAAFLRELTQGAKQRLDLLRGQYRGGLVEDQQRAVLNQAAHNLDPLALTNRQAVDVAARVQRHAVVFRDLADARFEFAAVAGLISGQAEGDVLGYCQGFKQ